MFDVGFTEILVIMVIALVVIGPERLPGAARTLGRWVGRIKRFVTSVRSDIEREFRAEELKRILDNQGREITELRDMMRKTESELRSSLKETEEAIQAQPISGDMPSDTSPPETASDDGKSGIHSKPAPPHDR